MIHGGLPKLVPHARNAQVYPVGAIYVEGQPLSETKNKEIAEFIVSRRQR